MRAYNTEVIAHLHQKSFQWYLAKRFVWLVFAIPFYQAGLAFTIWLLEPQNLKPAQELWAMAFPGMMLLFVLLQRRLGCASGHCPGRPTQDPAPPSRRVPDQSCGGKTAA